MPNDASSTAQASPSVLIPAPALASSRYNRQMLIPSISLAGQQRLSNAKILIIGLGGLGSPAALYLAGSGIHTLGLLDDDQVELSNLHRQIVHGESSVVGKMSKVQSAMQGCKNLNSEVRYVGHEMRLSSENALDVIGAYDLVLDCTDNPATRYLISDACVVLGKVLVSGAAQRGEGQLAVLNYPIVSDVAVEEEQDRRIDTSSRRRGPCYRCVFPRPPSPEMVRGCSEIGILGPVVGTIGTLMACEAIKLIVSGQVIKSSAKPWMLLYNAFSTDPRNMFRSIGLRGRREDCVACGEDETLASKGLQKITRKKLEEGGMDYVAFCGVVEDVNLLGKEHRTDAAQFMKDRADNSARRGIVVDVREETEFELGPKVKGSISIPISRILRRGGEIFDEMVPDENGSSTDAGTEPVWFVCQRGNDSQIAAQKLMERDGESSKRWIGDVRGGFVAMERELA